MARGSGVRFTVLVEDRALERFIRHCLLRLGAHRREIYIIPLALGRGSAKQRIDREYPVQIRAHRRWAFENVALVVGTDADEQTVQQCLQHLAEALREAGGDPRADQEQIAIWVPKWNIETWLLFLEGRDVQEEVNYKNQLGDVNFEATASEFVRRFRLSIHNPDAMSNLPSLVSAFVETRRIQRAMERASS